MGKWPIHTATKIMQSLTNAWNLYGKNYKVFLKDREKLVNKEVFFRGRHCGCGCPVVHGIKAKVGWVAFPRSNGKLPGHFEHIPLDFLMLPKQDFLLVSNRHFLNDFLLRDCFQFLLRDCFQRVALPDFVMYHLVHSVQSLSCVWLFLTPWTAAC